MILCIKDILDGAGLDSVLGAIGQASFEQGSRTAGWHAALVKRNEQLPRGPHLRKIEDLILTTLRGHDLFRAAALPRRFSSLLVSRYGEGMDYGFHVDDAIMGAGGDHPLRSDVSFTLFLSEPASYDGGELAIETTAEQRSYKLAAGSLVLYPSTSLHRVLPVTRGQRLAAVGWVQSLVRDAGRREILFDLDQARHSLFREQRKSPVFDLVSRSYSNLLRRWSDL